MTQPQPDRDAPPLPLAEPNAGLAATAPVAPDDSDHASLSHVPPHLLWASLEEAFAAPEDSTDAATEQRLPGYVGLAITLGLSLGLWAIIVKLVLLR